MRKKLLDRIWDGETVSVVCNSMKPRPGTNTIGWNGDACDISWLTRPHELGDSVAILVTIRGDAPKDAAKLLPACKCGREVNLRDPFKIFHWQRPDCACVEIAAKVGASEIVVEDPSEFVLAMAKDLAKAGITLSTSVVEEAEVVDEADNHHSMEE